MKTAVYLHRGSIDGSWGQQWHTLRPTSGNVAHCDASDRRALGWACYSQKWLKISVFELMFVSLWV